MSATIHHADAVQWANEYDGPLMHAMLCDPPYELAFMGRKWDSTGVAFRPETWAAFLRVLHPGAFGMAFASSRGWHRQAVAIEDAGFVIHPTLFGWVFASGFPKATRVRGEAAFDGHRYGLQALKPALEPIVIFQKPYSGKPVECIAATGAGALNVDAARIPASGESFSRPVNHTGLHDGWDRPWRHDDEALHRERARRDESEAKAEQLGRWPANFYITDDTAEPLDKLSDGASRFFFCAVADAIDEANAVCYAPKASCKERDAGLDGMPLYAPMYGGDKGDGLGRGISHTRQDWARHNPHPTVKPLSLVRWLASLLLPPAEYAPRRLFVPFAGVGSECIGAAQAGWEEVVGIETMNDAEHPYVDTARARIEHWTRVKQPALALVE